MFGASLPPPPPRGACAAAAPAPAAAPSGGWTEHTAPDGRRYYFHKASGKSAWEKPDELKSVQERAITASNTAWKEYTSASGKKYYFNTATRKTQWDMPDEMKAAAAAAAAAAGGGAPASLAPPSAPAVPAASVPAAAPTPVPAPASAAVAGNESMRAATISTPTGGTPAFVAAATAPVSASEPINEAEVATAKFMELLSSAGVKEEMEWEDAMKLIINSQSYRVLASLAERKATFVKWREQKREEREEAERKRQRQIKVDFVQLLKDTPALTSRTRFPKAIEMLSLEPRWIAIGDEFEREELFEEYAMSLERKEAAERRALRKERMTEFKSVLLQSGLTVRSQWRKVQVQLEEEPASKALDKIDRLAVYEEVARALEAEGEQQRQREREVERRLERKRRDQFRSLLSAKHSEGAFHVRSHWRDVSKVLAGTQEYQGALQQSGSTPAELFEDFIEQLNEQYQAHRKTLKAIMAALHGNFTVTLETKFDAFEAALRGADTDTLEGVPQSSLIAFLEELQDKLARDQVEEERRVERYRRAALDGYQDSLRGLMGALLSSSTTVRLSLCRAAFVTHSSHPSPSKVKRLLAVHLATACVSCVPMWQSNAVAPIVRRGSPQIRAMRPVA